MPELDKAENPHWSQAVLARHILAIGKDSLGGVRVRARAGPVRDAWIDMMRKTMPSDIPWLRVGPSLPAANLLGGIDLEQSLEAGRLIDAPGLLARAHGGFLVLAMAERLEKSIAAMIASAMDLGYVRSQSGKIMPARFTVIALDEGADPDERLPGILDDRLGLSVNLEPISIHDAQKHADESSHDFTRYDLPALPDALRQAICELSGRVDTRSMRLPFWLSHVARYCALLDGAEIADETHAAMALRLCTGLQISEAQPEQTAPEEPTVSEANGADDQPQPETHGDSDETDSEDDSTWISPEEIADMIVAASAVDRDELLSLPGIGGLQPRGNMAGGRGGASIAKSRRGRPCGLIGTPPTKDARPNAVATLRAAAPWQLIRRRQRAGQAKNLFVLPSDFRYVRYRDSPESTAIFAVDASGSTALDRLGEAKGAIELLLGDCYVRRNNVALISFRGKTAEVLLEPTRSLVRAKRSLTGLPGGGGTPLAEAISCTLELATQVRRRGAAPLLVYLTDGKANIALDGSADREQARSDAHKLAEKGAALGFKSLFIDVARRPKEHARDLASAMHAEYCVLPNASAASVSGVVGRHLQSDS